MSKKKHKKRNKPYTGEDAAPDKPVVHRYKAVYRSPLNEWWQARKRIIKIVSIAVGAVLLVVWLLVELIRLLV